jgi:NAD(P)-dependent dehydrogenase (short-subunit alcohol dehydrogenase family)
MTWVVTGGSSGIGAQLVLDLRGEGKQVVIWDRAAPAGSQDGFRQLDLTQPDTIESAAADIAGAVECFVHCAGRPSSASIGSASALEQMRAAYELHVVAFVRCVRALTKRLAVGKGSAIAVVSAAGDTVYPGTLAYGASKAALERTVQQMSVELAPAGIRVNAVMPGAIATPMTAESWADPRRAEDRLKYIPLGYQGQPSEVSSAIRFLASSGASYMTGATMRVDGGARFGVYSRGVRSAAPLTDLLD